LAYKDAALPSLKEVMNRKTWSTDKLVAGLAVALVAAAGLTAALTVGRRDTADPVVAAVGQVDTSGAHEEVVTAPPLKPPARSAAQAKRNSSARTAARAMGAAPVCRDCGVVQMVVAVYEYGQPQPDGYQMHIRMDDGSTRTVQQRGALAAGSRVMVQGDTVHVLADGPA
jgi:hypothetical protein